MIKVVLIPIVCPQCGSENIVKNGHDANGKQRYVCNNAECPRKAFVIEYTYNAYKPEVQQAILNLTVNGNGTRAIARALNIAPNTVTATLKKKKKSCNLSTKST